MSELIVTRIQATVSPSDADSIDFIAANDLANLVTEREWQRTDFSATAESALQYRDTNQFREIGLFVGKLDSEVVAFGTVRLPLTDNPEAAYLYLNVHPDYQRRGFGRQVYEVMEAFCRENGRRLLTGWAGAPPAAEGVPMIQPPNGIGEMPLEISAVQFPLAMGFDLGQVERMSILPLPADAEALAQMKREAEERAAAKYELVMWHDRVPEEYIDAFARCVQAMSTDAPMGDIEMDETDMTPDRIRESERKEQEAGITSVTTAAVHRESGRVAGYSTLNREEEHPEILNQDDTIVLKEHRGHRLGAWLKTANLENALQRWGSDFERIYTWNAQENDHMLSINEAMGFVPDGYEGAWQKKLSAEL